MSGKKQDFLSIMGKLHEEYFCREEEQRITKKLAEERATANVELAYRFANLAMPDDIRSRAKAWGMGEFCEVLWNNAFQAGFREARRTPDPVQIRADALREAAQAAHDATTHPSAYACQSAILALIDTPLSPTAVDGSLAPDAGSKEYK